MTMLKQSSTRNQRSKGFRMKHAIQILLLLSICIWTLYQVEQSYSKKVALKKNSLEVFAGLNVEQILRLGRKDLNPTLDELISEFEKHQELDEDERKLRDGKEDEGNAEDEEIEVSDEEKTEETEHEELEDLIDADDKI